MAEDTVMYYVAGPLRWPSLGGIVREGTAWTAAELQRKVPRTTLQSILARKALVPLGPAQLWETRARDALYTVVAWTDRPAPAEVLAQLLAWEQANPRHEGGRKTVCEAIEALLDEARENAATATGPQPAGKQGGEGAEGQQGADNGAQEG